MKKKNLLSSTGFTLLEVLLTLAVSTVLLGVITSVLITSANHNTKTQSHINLRQEANLIITQLRQQHQGAAYVLNVDDLLHNDQVQFAEIKLTNGNTRINETNKTGNISPSVDLDVRFTLMDQEKNEFAIDTVIEGNQLSGTTIDVEVPTDPEIETFYGFLRDKNVFVYGSEFSFSGSQVNGPNATMVIRGNLHGSQLNGGSFSNVSYIYIDGTVNIGGGSAGIGSKTNPGAIYVNNDVSFGSGNRDIYGDLYVNGNFDLGQATVYGNVYVNGNFSIGIDRSFDNFIKNTKGHIYYTGNMSVPSFFNIHDPSFPAKKVDSVPSFQMPNYDIPRLKPDKWYADNGYVSGGSLANSKRIFSKTDYAFTSSNTFRDVIIVSNGNITLSGWMHLTGVIFAPNGKVTFSGGSFEGLVIAKDGFDVISGGSTVTFKNIDQYIANQKDYPFENNTAK
ncbi:prepilin-type N-terminal cleavage/methylation domain-containing protein [bacterium LRH843]|nr:prepilin-type N-terminal cleavage/methylation domain-containing protein [bacterium LRH843]